MIEGLNPAFLIILGGLLLPLIPLTLRAPYMLLLPLLAMLQLCLHGYGDFGQLDLFGLPLITFRLDSLSFIFALIFHIATFLGVIYALHLRDTLQHVLGYPPLAQGIGHRGFGLLGSGH